MLKMKLMLTQLSTKLELKLKLKLSLAKVSHIMFADKICLQVSGTKYPVISTSYQVSGDHTWVGGGPS